MRKILTVREYGVREYTEVWQAMKTFTNNRTKVTEDQLWFLQHFPVFTLGQAGKVEHLIASGGIPIVKSDRGGQVTYHGPGQIVGYLLLDIKRQALGIKDLVCKIEQAIGDLLQTYGIDSHIRPKAPGVYVENRKIAALGLRLRRGCSYHGLSLNVDMDLEPFSRINPCGHQGLKVTQLKALGVDKPLPAVVQDLSRHIQQKFRYH